MTIYGYARCSINENKQEISRQKRELKVLGGVDEKNIYWEYESGNKVDGVELNRLLQRVVEGDTIVSTEVSRITRSNKQLCEIIDIVKKKHLKLVIDGFIVNCSKGKLDAMTDKMLGVFAKIERNMIAERVKSGMANVATNGKSVSRLTIAIETLPKELQVLS